MRDINKSFYSGRIGRDCEVKTFANTTKVSFSISNSRSKKVNGEWVQETMWLNCEKFYSGEQKDQLDKTVSALLKGAYVYIEAVMFEDKWVDKNSGQERKTFKFRVEDLQIISPPKSQEEQQGNYASKQRQQPNAPPKQGTLGYDQHDDGFGSSGDGGIPF